MQEMTEVERQLWQLNVELAQTALDSLDRMVLPERAKSEDLTVARARIENWLTDHKDQLGLDLLDRLWQRNNLDEEQAIALALEAQHKTRRR
jgi:hypothetical protein